MLFRTIYDEKLAQAAYLIGCQKTKEALIVDPERDVDRYIEIANREGLRITAIAETHIHADFLSGARELAERTGAKLYLSDDGDDDWKYLWVDKKVGGGAYDHHLLHSGDKFFVGNIEIEAIHTPGHTPEHMSYVVTDIGGGATEPMGIVTGDFVFVGDVGRPDLLETAAGNVGAKEPSARRLYDSLQGFLDLPDYMQVWPGHGAGSACGKALGAIPQSTVGYEKRFNGAVVDSKGDKEKFVAAILDGQPDPPLYFARMKRENKSGPAVLGSLPNPQELSASDISGLVANTNGRVVVDTRTRAEFFSGHLPGSLYAPLNKTFPTVTGSYCEPGDAIYLVVEEDRLREAVVDLIRIGLDNVVGYITPDAMAEHIASGGEHISTNDIDAATFAEIINTSKPWILDVRNVAEYASGHLEESHNIPHTRLGAHLGELPHDTTIYIHCQSGIRSSAASAYLETKGFDVVNLAAGFPEIAAAVAEGSTVGVGGSKD